MLLARNDAEMQGMKEEGLVQILSEVGLKRSELPIDD